MKKNRPGLLIVNDSEKDKSKQADNIVGPKICTVGDNSGLKIC